MRRVVFIFGAFLGGAVWVALAAQLPSAIASARSSAGEHMVIFNPAAATAAYLATVSPADTARAVAYTQGGHWALVGGWAVSVAVATLVLRSGLLRSLKRRLSSGAGRALLVSFVLGWVYLSADFVLESPWNAYIGWARERSFGLTSQPFLGWFAESTLSFLISAILISLFIVGFYALVRRSPGRWWLWSGIAATLGFVTLLYLLPPLVEPLFNRFSPAPAGPVKAAVESLARKAGVPAGQIYIYDGSRQSNRYTAHVSGVGPNARIAMSDVMFKKGADLAEVRAVAAHEMGHYAHGHALWSALIYGVLAIVLFALIKGLFPWVARLMGARNAVIADPSAIPVVAATAATLVFLATPLFNAVTRFEEADADRFSLALAQEPDGLARALVKTIAYRAASPTPIEEALFYDHPSVSRRVRAAMDWKASRLGMTPLGHGAGVPPAS